MNSDFTPENLLNTVFSKEIFDKESGKISGVYFTRREIDVIACIINGRSVKKIASFLAISSKTAENHIRNMQYYAKASV